MSKRGPKPIPTNLRLLKGGRRDEDSREPQFSQPAELPEPPVYLSGYARQEWDRVIGDLYSTGVYTNVDETMLAAYCMAFSRWVRAELDLEKMAAVDHRLGVGGYRVVIGRILRRSGHSHHGQS